MTVVRVKPGVEFTKIAPAGFRLLSAIDQMARRLGHDVTITSACDGEHSGPDDPHHSGEAYDVRTHDLPNKHLALETLQELLPDYAGSFYAFLEDVDTENEHIHCQRKKGTIYPPANDHEQVSSAVTGEQ